MIDHLSHRAAITIGSVAAAVAGFIADNPTDPTWTQGGVAAALFAVVLYFIKRGDAREEAARQSAAAREAALEKKIESLETQLLRKG